MDRDVGSSSLHRELLIRRSFRSGRSSQSRVQRRQGDDSSQCCVHCRRGTGRLAATACALQKGNRAFGSYSACIADREGSGQQLQFMLQCTCRAQHHTALADIRQRACGVLLRGEQLSMVAAL